MNRCPSGQRRRWWQRDDCANGQTGPSPAGTTHRAGLGVGHRTVSVWPVPAGDQDPGLVQRLRVSLAPVKCPARNQFKSVAGWGSGAQILWPGIDDLPRPTGPSQDGVVERFGADLQRSRPVPARDVLPPEPSLTATPTWRHIGLIARPGTPICLHVGVGPGGRVEDQVGAV
jgi:hypothetical protein